MSDPHFHHEYDGNGFFCTVTHQEDGCTCGGVAACQQCQDRDAADPVAAERRGTSGDNERCNRCDGENVIWFAPSPLWNLVMRGNDINGDALYGDLVCMPCFVVLAAEAGVEGVWRLAVDPEPDGLVLVTPSGRTWNAETSRWDTPDARNPEGDSLMPSRIEVLSSELEALRTEINEQTRPR